MLELTIKLYSFHELNQEAQTRAIEDHRRFMLETLQPDFIDGVTDWNDPEKMKMYHAECEYLEENDSAIIENIEINEYTFFANDDICWSCHYVAGPKKGLTEIKIHGELFTLGGGATE